MITLTIIITKMGKTNMINKCYCSKNDKDAICITWHIDDVKSRDVNMTKKQCRAVLDRASEDYDATIGINWDVLDFHISEIKGAKHGKS